MEEGFEVLECDSDFDDYSFLSVIVRSLFMVLTWSFYIAATRVEGKRSFHP